VHHGLDAVHRPFEIDKPSCAEAFREINKVVHLVPGERRGSRDYKSCDYSSPPDDICKDLEFRIDHQITDAP